MARSPPWLGAPLAGRQPWRSDRRHCGTHTLINSQETCLVTGLAAARQIGAGYPFNDPAKRSFNYYGGIMYGWRFRKA